MVNKELSINLLKLPHQEEAIQAIINSIRPLALGKETDSNGLVANSNYANPLLEGAFIESNNIDIKMETGTGKTYTYTRMMYELHKKMGLFKFIVVVPSAAIKEGARSFLTADYTKQHFKRSFPNTNLNVGFINKGDFGKAGRKEISNDIREFVEADSNDKNQIQVLVLNDKGFLNSDPDAKKPTSSLFKSDYEANLFGGETSPADMLAKTRSVVIIDEPHRLNRDTRSYQNIVNKIKPELIVRFGATFPESKIGSGKNKKIKKDYYRGHPQYDLNAVKSFNEGLVKGVKVYTPEDVNVSDTYKVKTVTKKNLVLEYKNQSYELKTGDQLKEIDDRFQGGLSYQGTVKKGVGILSNSLTIEPKMKLVPAIFTDSYQKIMIRQALDAHFTTERENFLREGYQVKTNALFFIDNIDSYRDRGNGATWLKNIFEELLAEKLTKLIAEEKNVEYKEFLEETLNNISDSHGGYFASDIKSNKNEPGIAEEIDVILRNKAKSLRLKDDHGHWNILRFFFSQWTLREGWDNPNVFTIAKLRSSGSETSKLQEVGRGLRLPVDCKGRRLGEQEWWLNFVVDSSEKKFADSLRDEINSQSSLQIVEHETLKTEVINELITNDYGHNRTQVITSLLEAGLIDDDWNVIDSEAIQHLLPENNANQKIRNGNLRSENKVKLVKSNWNEISDFWKEIRQRYMIVFEKIPKDDLKSLFYEAISSPEIFDDNKKIKMSVRKLAKNDVNQKLTLDVSYELIANDGDVGCIPYNTFLRMINKETCLPTHIIHEQLSKRLLGVDNADKRINEKTLGKILENWRRVFLEKYATRYHYDRLNFRANTSVFKDGNLVDDISRGLLGEIPAENVVDQRNLFEEVFVDSINPEKKIAQIIPDESIKVFGKLPKKAIQVPTYVGGTTTPDFIFATKDNLFLLVESKPSGDAGLRDSEKIAVSAQRDFFNKMNTEWAMVTSADEVMNILRDLNKK